MTSRKAKNSYGYGMGEREIKWLRRGRSGAGGFFITGKDMAPRKGFAKGWPTKKGIERLLDMGMIFRDTVHDDIFYRDGELESYRYTARAVHVLAGAGGYEVDGQVWTEERIVIS